MSVGDIKSKCKKCKKEIKKVGDVDKKATGGKLSEEKVIGQMSLAEMRRRVLGYKEGGKADATKEAFYKSGFKNLRWKG